MIKDKRAPEVENTEEPVEEKKPVYTKKPVNVDDFIARKLKVINEWPDGAKKKNAAERLFKNKEA